MGFDEQRGAEYVEFNFVWIWKIIVAVRVITGKSLENVQESINLGEDVNVLCMVHHSDMLQFVRMIIAVSIGEKIKEGEGRAAHKA